MTRSRLPALGSSSATVGEFIKMKALQFVALGEGGWREMEESGVTGKERGVLLGCAEPSSIKVSSRKWL